MTKVKITLADGSVYSAKAKGSVKAAVAKLTAKYARGSAVAGVEVKLAGGGRIFTRGLL